MHTAATPNTNLVINCEGQQRADEGPDPVLCADTVGVKAV